MGCLHSRMGILFACRCFMVKRIVHITAAVATAATTATAAATVDAATLPPPLPPPLPPLPLPSLPLPSLPPLTLLQQLQPPCCKLNHPSHCHHHWQHLHCCHHCQSHIIKKVGDQILFVNSLIPRPQNNRIKGSCSHFI